MSKLISRIRSSNSAFLALTAAIGLCPSQSAFAASNGPDIQLIDPEPFQRQVVDALRNLQKSPYQTLKGKFENAREPEENDLSRYRPGRCYYSDRPMQPVAALLTMETTADDGPAFTGKAFRKILPFVSKHSPPSFFDTLTPEKLALVHKKETRFKNDVAFPVRSNASLRSFIPRSMTIQARSYELRSKGKFLLMKVACEDQGGCFNRMQTWVYYYEDEDVAYCYFFRP